MPLFNLFGSPYDFGAKIHALESLVAFKKLHLRGLNPPQNCKDWEIAPFLDTVFGKENVFWDRYIPAKPRGCDDLSEDGEAWIIVENYLTRLHHMVYIYIPGLKECASLQDYKNLIGIVKEVCQPKGPVDTPEGLDSYFLSEFDQLQNCWWFDGGLIVHYIDPPDEMDTEDYVPCLEIYEAFIKFYDYLQEIKNKEG